MSRRVPAPAATYEQELLTAARNVARLQAKRRRYRRLLRELDAELRHERKMLKAIAGRNDERRPDVAPSRLTHGATGYVAEPRDVVTVKTRIDHLPAPDALGLDDWTLDDERAERAALADLAERFPNTTPDERRAMLRNPIPTAGVK